MKRKSPRPAVLESYLANGHALPRTRREFLGAGLIGSMSFVAVPTLLQVLSEGAAADGLSPECAAAMNPVGGWMPIIHVNLAGGAALHYNALVLGKDRQPLSSYTRLGLGPTANFNVRNYFGNVPLAERGGQVLSPLFANLFTNAGAGAIDKSAVVKFCVRSQDDSPANKDSIMGLANAAGLMGTHLPNLSYVSGGHGANPTAFLPSAPLQIVRSVSGLTSALSPQGTLKTALLNPKSRGLLLSLVERLNRGQRQKLMGSASAEAIAKMSECAAAKNRDLASVDGSDLDPRRDGAIAAAWGVGADTLDTNPDLIYAAVVYNVLGGKAPSARISLGGYDYHGQTREAQDERDATAGRVIGRILKTAELMNRAVFVHVTSDGSVEASAKTEADPFGADAGARGSGFFLVYDPKGRPPVSDVQIGHFNAAQAVDESFINTWTPDRAALAVFANYLQLHSRLDLLNTLAPNQYSTADLNKLVKVA